MDEIKEQVTHKINILQVSEILTEIPLELLNKSTCIIKYVGAGATQLVLKEFTAIDIDSVCVDNKINRSELLEMQNK